MPGLLASLAALAPALPVPGSAVCAPAHALRLTSTNTTTNAQRQRQTTQIETLHRRIHTQLMAIEHLRRVEGFVVCNISADHLGELIVCFSRRAWAVKIRSVAAAPFGWLSCTLDLTRVL